MIPVNALEVHTRAQKRDQKLEIATGLLDIHYIRKQ
jgi:hypothetical protein